MTETSDSKNRPSHLAYAVRDYAKKDGEVDATWRQIGVAFAHKNGQGFNIMLDATPVSGRIVLRANEPKTSKS